MSSVMDRLEGDLMSGLTAAQAAHPVGRRYGTQWVLLVLHLGVLEQYRPE